MKQYYTIILSLCVAFSLVTSCALYQPRYAGKKGISLSLPSKKSVQTFYLIGDAGYAKEGKTTSGLKALKKYLDTNATPKDHVIFLGDNIYPAGMPPKDHEDRSISEHRLDVQIEAVKDFKGEITIIPGNHDWYNQGLSGVKRQEKYLEKALNDKKLFHPTNGCALESFDINDQVQLVVFDSEWYLEDWDEHPTINDDCPQLKTRTAALNAIESEFKKNQNKTILFVQHHPLYTNGPHGGQYAPVKHLYPSQKKIPLPGLASIATLARTAGGVSPQDTQNKQYKSLVQKITALASPYKNIIFASGHEHSIQYIEHNKIKQIVSGSGSKNSYATLSNDGLFALGKQGFAELKIYEDGSSWVSFYASESGIPKLVYRKEIIKEKAPYPIDSIITSTAAHKKAAIYVKKEGEKHKKSIWGNRYDSLYYVPVKTKVAFLDTLYGGLKVVRAGGGHQTESLRLQAKDGKEYNMRLLKKNGIQFLQSTIFQNRYIGSLLNETQVEYWLDDIYTAAHPYGFLTIPDLSDAINVRHTNPELFYVPKQKTLGDYNATHGDALYMIVERPEKNHKDDPDFGKPDDIESTADLLERLRRDEKYKVDEASYIRARLFDMLIGDWDRHEDQWRWAEYKLDNGDHIFKPIPRDRDQVFSNFDGTVFSGLRGVLEFAKQFGTYGPKIKNIEWLNASGAVLDRALLKNATLEDWVAQADYIKAQLGDAAIEKAFQKLPVEVYEKSTKEIIKNIKSRRNFLDKTAKKYYQFVSELVIVTATDKDDFIDIQRMENGKTSIRIQRIKNGEPADMVSERIYDKKNTKEIWVYALDDDDVFKVTGNAENPIKIRLIGGQNNDVYNIENGKKITLYDYKSKPNTIKRKGSAKKILTDRYQINHFNPYDRFRNTYAVLPAIGFNPDDGVRLGITSTITKNHFFRNPFTYKHTFGASYYFATQGFLATYEGRFAGILGDYNLVVSGAFKTPNFAENYFGFGNNSENNDDEIEFDFNRVRISTIQAKIGAQKNGRFGSNFRFNTLIEGIEVENTNGRFVNALFDPSNRVFDRQWFTGLEAGYSYESYDVKANPTRGMRFGIEAGNRFNLTTSSRHFGFVKSNLGFYNALTNNRKWVLKTDVRSVFNIGNEFEFYQAAQIGGHGLLRGYRNQRFSGNTALSGSADVRYSFNTFKTKFLPVQLGVLAGSGVGRVWSVADTSNTWHADYGIGFWVNSLDVAQGTFHLFSGEDGPRFSFNFLFNF